MDTVRRPEPLLTLGPDQRLELARWGAALVAGRPPGRLETGANPAVAALLGRRGLAGLAWAAVQRGEADVDLELAAGLESAYAFEAVRGGEALDAAVHLRGVLADAGIPSLLLKGAALIRQGVWAEGERRIGDIDLIVPPEDAVRSVEVLCQEGLRPWVPWQKGRERWYSAFSLDLPGPTDDLTVPVDLHWSSRYAGLRYRPSSAPDPIWEGADLQSGVPADAPHVAMIADHLLKHLRVITHLAGFADLVRLLPRLDTPDADATVLLDHARRRGIEYRMPRLMDVLDQAFGVTERACEGIPVPLRRTGRPIPDLLTRDRLVLEDAAAEGRGGGLRLRWAMGGEATTDLAEALLPEGAWLAARYPEIASPVARRIEHISRVTRWLAGRGTSPLAPNQEFESPGGRT